MTGDGRFAKWRLVGSPLENPLRRLDVHALDHLIAEALGAAVERLDERFGTLDLRRGRREGAVAGVDLARMDQALAVETEPAALLRLRHEAVRIFEAIEHAIKCRDARRAGG